MNKYILTIYIKRDKSIEVKDLNFSFSFQEENIDLAKQKAEKVCKQWGAITYDLHQLTEDAFNSSYPKLMIYNYSTNEEE